MPIPTRWLPEFFMRLFKTYVGFAFWLGHPVGGQIILRKLLYKLADQVAGIIIEVRIEMVGEWLSINIKYRWSRFMLCRHKSLAFAG